MTARRLLTLPAALIAASTLACGQDRADTLVGPDLDPQMAAAVHDRFEVRPATARAGATVGLHDREGFLAAGQWVTLSGRYGEVLPLTVNRGNNVGRFTLPESLACGRYWISLPDLYGSSFISAVSVAYVEDRHVEVEPELLGDSHFFALHDPQGRFQPGDYVYFTAVEDDTCWAPEFAPIALDVQVSADGSLLTGVTSSVLSGYRPPGILYVGPSKDGPWRTDPIPVTYVNGGS